MGPKETSDVTVTGTDFLSDQRHPVWGEIAERLGREFADHVHGHCPGAFTKGLREALISHHRRFQRAAKRLEAISKKKIGPEESGPRGNPAPSV
jgi:hypothetical protein